MTQEEPAPKVGQTTTRPNKWQTWALWGATVAFVLVVVSLILMLVGFETPILEGPRLWATVIFTPILGVSIAVAWHRKVRSVPAQWDQLAIGPWLIIGTWSMVDRGLVAFDEGLWVWFGIWVVGALLFMVLTDAVLWRGLRRKRDRWTR